MTLIISDAAGKGNSERKGVMIMIKMALRVVLTALVFLGLDAINFIQVESFGAAVAAVIVLALLNFFVGGILKLMTLPINFLTLGLVSVLINVFVLFLLNSIMGGVELGGFLTLLGLSLILGFVEPIIENVVD